MLTYIGFDGISTLTDEAKDPARSVPRAIVLTCLITGVLASIEVYVAQLVWPRGVAFPDVDTAYVHVSGRMGGPILLRHRECCAAAGQYRFGHGVAARRGAAALCDGPGRRNSPSLLRRRQPKNRIPRNNVLLIGAVCLVGALSLQLSAGTELLNYGALLAFMGVNLASMLRGWRHGRWSQMDTHVDFARRHRLPAQCCGGTSVR